MAAKKGSHSVDFLSFAGVALSLAVVIHKAFGTLDDDELTERKRAS